MNVKVITIDRQYASGGREVGKILSKKLNIPFYDGELLLLAAEKYGLNPGMLKDLDEKPTNSILYNIAMVASGEHNFDKAMLPYKIFQAEADTMRHLVHEGPCIIIGRCADAVLNDMGKVFRVFVYASSLEEKIKRANTVDHIRVEDAVSYMKKKDKRRKEYYKFNTNKEWGNINNYDICLNSTSFGYEGCADIIMGAVHGNVKKVK